MSLTYTQLLDLIDDNVKSNSTSYSTADKTRDINLALDRALSLIFSVGGTWQFDDSNHTDYPIITTDLVSGQRSYAFTSDGSSNLILEIYKVMVADSNGLFREMTPVDQQAVNPNSPSNYWDGLNTTGIPNTYDKTSNGIFLDPIPNYDRTAGLKIFINREASYFTVSDTTKKSGIAGLFHEYLALRPSYQYAFRNSLPNTAVLKAETTEMENAMMDYYKKREKDVIKRVTGKQNNYK